MTGLLGREAPHNSPGHGGSEAVRVGAGPYADNTAWLAGHNELAARHAADLRLAAAGPVYAAAAQYGQSPVMNAGPPPDTTPRPVLWTTGDETPAPSTNTCQQQPPSTVTPGRSVSGFLVFLGLSVLDLGPMYATDRRQTDARQKHRLLPRLLGAGA